MVVFDYELCSSCSICTAVCPAGIINDKEGIPSIKAGLEVHCIRCGHCEAHCPVQAVSVEYPEARPFTGAVSASPVTAQQISGHLAGRRSVRRYKDTPVEKKVIEELLEVARFSPTGSNAQPVAWTIILDRQKMREMAQTVVEWMKGLIAAYPDRPDSQYFSLFVNEWDKGRDRIFRGAPHLAVVHGPSDGRLGNTNGVIAATYLEVAAPAFGIGTCWAGLFLIASQFSPELRAKLELPEDHSAQGALMFGYPEYQPSRIPKRNAGRVRWM
ncbi:MAG: 4Fe-4S binding protein [Firmicutes bacterium]|nr:4Fe-4S binding protein [Bacillota bacterium]